VSICSRDCYCCSSSISKKLYAYQVLKRMEHFLLLKEKYYVKYKEKYFVFVMLIHCNLACGSMPL
jgi:hypothetical protein